MTHDYFRTGGPNKVKRMDPNHIKMSVPVETDEHERVARSCPKDDCSPGYFKIRYGTGILTPQEEVYCPYCRAPGAPGAFFTCEQLRYMKEVVVHESAIAIQNMFKNACRGGGGFLKYTPGRLPSVRRPFEETVQRDVVCPHCGLDHAVFGLATWCPDCGKDILLTHVQAEVSVVHTMLGDVARRGELFGPRIAARDLENCLEDAVSIFEAVMKAFLIRHLKDRGETEEAIQALLEERIRNGFQNIERAATIVQNRMGVDLFEGIPSETVQRTKTTFEKRHPITHNLGVMDRKYLADARQDAQEGRDVRVTGEEIMQSLDVCLSALTNLHARLFAAGKPD